MFKFLGRNAKIYSFARIINEQNISIGESVIIDDGVILEASGDGIDIGDFSHICLGTIMQAGGKITIGRFTAIAPRCVVMASTDSYDGNGFVGNSVFPDKYRDHKCLPVIIGNHVHVGMGSIIMPGVTLGEGCSIGAGSLVTKNMPEWAICYGSPCRVMRGKPRARQLQMEKEFLEEYRKEHP
jgi:acetyltransferase-like isoleucine patch superfamily enzyme